MGARSFVRVAEPLQLQLQRTIVIRILVHRQYTAAWLTRMNLEMVVGIADPW